MPLTSLADGLLFGERYGSGPIRVVALHGWGRDRRDFRRVLEGLDAMAIDLPGFGATPPPAGAAGAAGYARMVASWLEQLPGPQILVGHSFGGRVAVVLAATRPELVAGLVLVGVPLLHRLDRTARGPSVTYRLVRLANRAGLVSDERLEREKRRRGSDDYREATGVMRDTLVMVVNESYEDRLPDVACPVRLVWGEADSEVPPEVAHRAGALLKNADTDVVEGCGHDLPREAPDRIRAAIETLI
ncbi:MAG: alpha/beta hydrolase [Acidimicrobiia bacterium]|nr:alpha/beta hydrolase [Acidimicrobiia bacterium]